MKRHILVLVLLSSVYPAPSLLAVERSGLNVTVDPRIELLSVVQFLSGSGALTRYDFQYKRSVQSWFSGYKDHPAVRLLAEMRRTGFDFDAPVTAMLCAADPPDLRVQIPFSEYVKERAGGQERLDRLVSLLRDFARETRFEAFFEKNKDLYHRMTEDIRRTAGASDDIAALEGYYGKRQHSYNLILAPLRHDGGIGPRLERADGTFDIYSIIGPSGIRNGIPSFGSQDDLRYLLWHEFSHSFVNPLTGKYWDLIRRYSSLGQPISSQMRKHGYSQWQTCVNEHIVRAVTTRLICRQLGQDEGDRALEREKSQAFAYVEALCERLTEYEQQRRRYPALEDFYPRIIDLFNELSTRHLEDTFYTIPFNGTVDSIVFDDEASILFIVPTGESDRDAQRRIQAYVKRFRDLLFQNSSILEDQEALHQDLSAYTLMVFGTSTGNLWLRHHLGNLPVRIEPDRIVAHAVHPGTQLRLIAAWPNPENPEKGVLIFTAQQPRDIVGIGAVLRLQTSFLIAKGAEVLSRGDYRLGWTSRWKSDRR